ncbi:DUF2075 domain-containing protein [Collinsella sp. AGMB00827]|uniref:DUF2075 domain-containing protein n=1 Tax=Collinsella ureilytica TaxID=2869515 RepID=A0ABS7MPA9_9ACTN|nr:DNA/RNA helicase domain-containing protein [Collinsella urealyticum]MBY4798230.1 DUF2075 domain-containing protein [Collinsella urealyticum]
MSERQKMLVAQLPYGTGALVRQSAAALHSDRAYRELVEQSFLSDQMHGGLAVFVFPKRPDDYKTRATLFHQLTNSPVVYIVSIRLSQQQLMSGWLADVIGDVCNRSDKRYKVDKVIYVGETNDILKRTNQHLAQSLRLKEALSDEDLYEDFRIVADERTQADKVIQAAVAAGLEVKQYVIWHNFFTKSMTLDIENKYIDYFQSTDGVFTLNGRGNAQRNYYKVEEKDKVGSRAWQRLSLFDPDLFPPESDIWNSDLYKISPFHALGEEQSKAVDAVCKSAAALLSGLPICGERLEKADSSHRLLVLEGASGTGKSIVLSTLFLRLSQMLRDDDEEAVALGIRPNNRVNLVVNQSQQLTMYSNLARKLGLMRSQSSSDACVYQATRFLNLMQKGERTRPDIVLVDEAHLLWNKSNRGYSAKRGHHGNQLLDILLQAKVVIAVFDPIQVMRRDQEFDQDFIDAILPANRLESGDLSYLGAVKLRSHRDTQDTNSWTFNSYHIGLSEQFRIHADEETISWIDRLVDKEKRGMDLIPSGGLGASGLAVQDTDKYDLRVYSSPELLAQAIDRRRKEMEKAGASETSPTLTRARSPLCRLLATYDWEYKRNSGKTAVELYGILPTKQGASELGEIEWVMPDDARLDVEIDSSECIHFSRNWNYIESDQEGKRIWSSDPDAENEVGSYFSIQGFDLNYAGVIIGPSVTYREGKIVVNPAASNDQQARGENAEDLILQQLKVLLRRGIWGLYLFAVDRELQAALERSARSVERLDLES